jgi:hypothetical protein
MNAADRMALHDAIEDFHGAIDELIARSETELLTDFCQGLIDILPDENRAQLRLARRPPITLAEAKMVGRIQ